MRVNWNPCIKRNLAFQDLKTNDTFKYSGPRSKGAVYTKVMDTHGVYHALEIATGNLYPAINTAEVELVDVYVTIDSGKPNL